MNKKIAVSLGILVVGTLLAYSSFANFGQKYKIKICTTALFDANDNLFETQTLRAVSPGDHHKILEMNEFGRNRTSKTALEYPKAARYEIICQDAAFYTY